MGQRKGTCPGLRGPAWGPAGKDGERAGAQTGPLGPGRGRVTHLRDLFAILQVPHRRGLGGDAGQPPPASGECSLSETLPPLPPLLPSGGRQRKAGPVRSGTEGRTKDPLLLAAARPGQGCPHHVRRRAPALRPPLPPPPPPPPPRRCRPGAAPSRAPTPALSPQRAALQHSQPPAGFCPHRRISRLASLKSRRLNLRTRPRTSLAGAAARGGGGRGARARRRAGPAALEAGTGTRGSRGERGPVRGPGGLTGPGTLSGPHGGGDAPRGGCREGEFLHCGAWAGSRPGTDPATATSGAVRSVPLGRGHPGSWAAEDLAGCGSRAVSLAT